MTSQLASDFHWHLTSTWSQEHIQGYGNELNKLNENNIHLGRKKGEIAIEKELDPAGRNWKD